MDKTKMEQIKDKICDYMLGMDLSKLSLMDLRAYIDAYKALDGGYSFPGMGWGLGCASSAPTV